MTRLNGKITAKKLATAQSNGITSFSYEVIPSPREDEFEWKLGVSFSCILIGPPRAKQYLIEKATMLLNNEVYGDLEHELFELYRMLCKEKYRDVHDPVIEKLQQLIYYTRGRTGE